MTKRQVQPWPGAPDRLAVAHEHLARAVEELTTEPGWRHMLLLAARFPTYSANNVLLIGAQRPEASCVAGLRAWNSLGRYVRKGEKGIAILAPCLYRPRTPDPVATEEPAPGQVGQLRGFRVVHVFDVSQTDGKPLPQLGPAELAGPAPAGLVERLATVIGNDGFTVERGECGDAYGFTDFARRRVRVRDRVDDAQAAKTFAHELAHIRAEHEVRFLADYPTSIGCRAQAEIEAESISYLISRAAGMASDQYAVPYLAGWSGGDCTLIRDAATRIVNVARDAIRDLDLLPPSPVSPSRAASLSQPGRRAVIRPPHDPLSA